MDIDRMLTQSGQVLAFAGGAPDRYGNPTAVWSTGPTVRAWLEPLSGAEVLADRNLQVGDVRLFVRPDLALSGLDRWQSANGDVWEVIGPPLVYSDRHGTPHHQEAILRRYKD